MKAGPVVSFLFLLLAALMMIVAYGFGRQDDQDEPIRTKDRLSTPIPILSYPTLPPHLLTPPPTEPRTSTGLQIVSNATYTPHPTATYDPNPPTPAVKPTPTPIPSCLVTNVGLCVMGDLTPTTQPIPEMRQ